MTHAWSIIIVLSVSAVMFYAGVFEATGRPRFEGLAAASLQPMPEQVQLYSDGILVLAIANTKPYKYTYEWVEVAPIANQDDMIRTNLGGEIPQGGIGIYYINGTNLLGGISGAAVMMLPDARAGEDSIDFHYRHQESYHAAGISNTYTTPWAKALQITVNPGTSPGGTASPPYCVTGGCDCTKTPDCPLDCQVCNLGKCDNDIGCPGEMVSCASTESHHDGECVVLDQPGYCYNHEECSCIDYAYCPLTCQTCSGGWCNNYEGCEGRYGNYCYPTPSAPSGECLWEPVLV